MERRVQPGSVSSPARPPAILRLPEQPKVPPYAALRAEAEEIDSISLLAVST